MAASAPLFSAQSRIHAELTSGHTGVRITGAPLPSLDDSEFAEVQRLISSYCVAVFPGQCLSPADHVAFMSRLGPITVTPGVDLHPEIENVHVVKNREAPRARCPAASIPTRALLNAPRRTPL